MSTKTTFKRIALVAVAALGLGVLSVAPSQAAVSVIGDTLTVSATAATIGYGETATITITEEFTSTISFVTNGTAETMSVYMIADGAGTASVSSVLIKQTTDSANTKAVGGTRELTLSTGSASASSLGASMIESVTPVTAGAYTKQTLTVKFYNNNATTTGTTRYTITTRAGDGTISKVAYIDLTTTKATTTGSATYSKMWLNAVSTVGTPWNTADSTLVVSAGTAAAAGTTAVAYLIPEIRGATDTTTTSAGSLANDSITVVVSGPGLIKSQTSRSLTGGADQTTASKSLIISQGDTIVVYGDGTAGVSTLTASIGGVNLTQAAKTLTFFGKPASITATLDSATVVSTATANRPISFVVKDSAGFALSNTNLVYNTGTPGSGFYAVYSDTKVVTGTANSASAAPSWTLCNTYNADTAKWYCSLGITDSGTVSIVIADSKTAATSVATVSSAMSLTVVGGAWTGTAAFDKTSYAPGEKAILTLTAKDYAGNVVADGTANPYANLVWGSLANPTFAVSTGSDAAGGTFTSLNTYLTGTNTFKTGTDTAVVSMPTVVGTYTLSGTTNGGDKKAWSLTFTVVDPNAAAIAAAKDASDAATDAALEATDAAYAATDAANIAAEAADAATAAAEAATEAANAAKESADAATAAVEELATSVAKLMAALQAQITTLAKVVAKIAVKVKA